MTHDERDRLDAARTEADALRTLPYFDVADFAAQKRAYRELQASFGYRVWEFDRAAWEALGPGGWRDMLRAEGYGPSCASLDFLEHAVTVTCKARVGDAAR